LFPAQINCYNLISSPAVNKLQQMDYT
jgi:hypothetical protein